jgi:DNA invertase Pin-like site-specific DNA recombinase
VAIYIRWSTEEQGDGTTLDIQRERCSLFTRSQGWMDREELTFIDEGYTGANLGRPAMTRLRQAVQDGSVDCVVSYKLDRISRNLADTVTLVRQEWSGKCVYRSATEGFDTSEDSPTGGLIFNILASFAEFERAVIRDRTRAGSLRRMKEGMYISGTVPYGYVRAGKGHLAIKPGESETVARIFDMIISNITSSSTTIARRLNEEGLPGPSGGRWWTSAVERILKNPLYCGTLVYGKSALPRSSKGGHARHDVQGEILAEVEDAVPAIIPKEQFEKVQVTLNQRKGAKPHKANRASSDYLFTSIGTCKCGGPLGGVKDRHGNVYYRCGRRQQGVVCAFASVAFRGAVAEQRVISALRARFGGTRREEALAVIRERFYSSTRRSELELAIKETGRRTTDVLDDLTRLRRAARRGELKSSTYEEFKADAEAELRELEDRLRELHAQHAGTGHDAALLDCLERAVEAVDEWDMLTGSERKGLLRTLCEQLSIYYPGNRKEIEVQVRWIG